MERNVEKYKSLINTNKKKETHLWTKEEVDFLKENYPEKGEKYCAEHLGLTTNVAGGKARRLGLRTGKMKMWTIEEDDFLYKNYKEKGLRYCAEMLDHPINSVYSRYRLIKNNEPVEHQWTEFEEKFLIEYYPHYGSEYCANKLKLNNNIVKHKVLVLKLKINWQTHYEIEKYIASYGKTIINDIDYYTTKKQSQKINTDFFTNPDKFGAYALGFLYADGCITKQNNSYKTMLGILKSDYEQIKDIFDRAGTWTYYEKSLPSNGKIASYISSCNKNLFNFLSDNDYQIKSTSSADKILNYIHPILHKYWFRGFFDGDGSIYSAGGEVSFTGNIEMSWNFLTTLLDKLSIKYSVKRRSHSQKNLPDSYYSCIKIMNYKGIIKFGQYIYGDEYDKVGLNRKYKKFQEFFQKPAARRILYLQK